MKHLFLLPLVLGVIACLISQLTVADSFAPSYHCTEPYKPYSFDSQWALDNFNQAVDRYRRCLTDFANQQFAEAEQHREAAQRAMAEWNRYAQFELDR